MPALTRDWTLVPSGLSVPDYIREEVRRQGRGPVQVDWMLEAWHYTWNQDRLSLPLIGRVGHLIEPEYNDGLWRQVRIWAGTHEKAPPAAVPRLMEAWMEAVNDGRFVPAEAYYEFEEIHPFRDGNGRTGKVILNFLAGTMDEPVWPPNFWGISNP